MNQTQRIAIVTGAGRGIGEAIALRFARLGMAVGLLDIQKENVERVKEAVIGEGGAAAAIACDVGSSASVEAAIAAVENAFHGTPLILVNNAGVGGPFHRIDEVSDEEWERIISTNLRSVFLFARHLLPKMKAAYFGRIVNIASVQGLFGASRSSTYVASKHGMIGYTKAIAAEWGPFGITCNAICPGYVDTAMGVQAGEVGDHLRKVLDKSPVKRIAQPDEIAAMAAHLVGPDSGYINGACITLDGGITCHVGIE
ncbi:SDR family oxidoreductase [Brevibacillus sp. SYP-B805]|uniref:SDR family NAD(P)-dependent oxidoreductase n=1 Tax=Brevibacillus sp. SYP-B805 TaxID=1578199 RepID=UPI0013EBF0F7|nr:SDR family NAD(P)-dependent oxidoreductase [Brevibacillus sp. SYP-B805]NGQ93742.1 SDR family oxidoreductase [Brevibacillus sp. SYP-B805]